MDDPYLAPAFGFQNKVARLLWNVVYVLAFRTSPRPLFRWRAFLLRIFGAQIGPQCAIYPTVEVWAPWNLVCGPVVAIADGAVIYNPAKVALGSHAIISQEAYICGATHDLDNVSFPLVSKPISIGDYSWVCARAVVLPGVQVGAGAVLGLGSIATRNLEAWTVYAGNPARNLRERRRG